MLGFARVWTWENVAFPFTPGDTYGFGGAAFGPGQLTTACPVLRNVAYWNITKAGRAEWPFVVGDGLYVGSPHLGLLHEARSRQMWLAALDPGGTEVEIGGDGPSPVSLLRNCGTLPPSFGTPVPWFGGLSVDVSPSNAAPYTAHLGVSPHPAASGRSSPSTEPIWYDIQASGSVWTREGRYIHSTTSALPVQFTDPSITWQCTPDHRAGTTGGAYWAAYSSDGVVSDLPVSLVLTSAEGGSGRDGQLAALGPGDDSFTLYLPLGAAEDWRISTRNGLQWELDEASLTSMRIEIDQALGALRSDLVALLDDTRSWKWYGVGAVKAWHLDTTIAGRPVSWVPVDGAAWDAATAASDVPFTAIAPAPWMFIELYDGAWTLRDPLGNWFDSGLDPATTSVDDLLTGRGTWELDQTLVDGVPQDWRWTTLSPHVGEEFTFFGSDRLSDTQPNGVATAASSNHYGHECDLGPGAHPWVPEDDLPIAAQTAAVPTASLITLPNGWSFDLVLIADGVEIPPEEGVAGVPNDAECPSRLSGLAETINAEHGKRCFYNFNDHVTGLPVPDYGFGGVVIELAYQGVPPGDLAAALIFADGSADQDPLIEVPYDVVLELMLADTRATSWVAVSQNGDTLDVDAFRMSLLTCRGKDSHPATEFHAQLHIQYKDGGDHETYILQAGATQLPKIPEYAPDLDPCVRGFPGLAIGPGPNPIPCLPWPCQPALEGRYDPAGMEAELGGGHVDATASTYASVDAEYQVHVGSRVLRQVRGDHPLFPDPLDSTVHVQDDACHAVGKVLVLGGVCETEGPNTDALEDLMPGPDAIMTTCHQSLITSGDDLGCNEMRMPVPEIQAVRNQALGGYRLNIKQVDLEIQRATFDEYQVKKQVPGWNIGHLTAGLDAQDSGSEPLARDHLALNRFDYQQINDCLITNARVEYSMVPTVEPATGTPDAYEHVQTLSFSRYEIGGPVQSTDRIENGCGSPSVSTAVVVAAESEGERYVNELMVMTNDAARDPAASEEGRERPTVTIAKRDCAISLCKDVLDLKIEMGAGNTYAGSELRVVSSSEVQTGFWFDPAPEELEARSGPDIDGPLDWTPHAAGLAAFKPLAGTMFEVFTGESLASSPEEAGKLATSADTHDTSFLGEENARFASRWSYSTNEESRGATFRTIEDGTVYNARRLFLHAEHDAAITIGAIGRDSDDIPLVTDRKSVWLNDSKYKQWDARVEANLDVAASQHADSFRIGELTFFDLWMDTSKKVPFDQNRPVLLGAEPDAPPRTQLFDLFVPAHKVDHEGNRCDLHFMVEAHPDHYYTFDPDTDGNHARNTGGPRDQRATLDLDLDGTTQATLEAGGPPDTIGYWYDMGPNDAYDARDCKGTVATASTTTAVTAPAIISFGFHVAVSSVDLTIFAAGALTSGAADEYFSGTWTVPEDDVRAMGSFKTIGKYAVRGFALACGFGGWWTIGLCIVALLLIISWVLWKLLVWYDWIFNLAEQAAHDFDQLIKELHFWNVTEPPDPEA